MKQPNDPFWQCQSCKNFLWGGPLNNEVEDEYCNAGIELYTKDCEKWEDWNEDGENK